MTIKIVPPNQKVELHLPDGRVLSGPRGAQAGEFLKKVRGDFSGPIVAVIAAFGSAVTSLVTSSLLLTPALWFIRRANGMEPVEPETEAQPAD